MLPMIYMSVIDDDDVPDFEKIYKKNRDKAYMTAFNILADGIGVHSLFTELSLTLI